MGSSQNHYEDWEPSSGLCSQEWSPKSCSRNSLVRRLPLLMLFRALNSVLRPPPPLPWALNLATTALLQEKNCLYLFLSLLLCATSSVTQDRAGASDWLRAGHWAWIRLQRRMVKHLSTSNSFYQDMGIRLYFLPKFTCQWILQAQRVQMLEHKITTKYVHYSHAQTVVHGAAALRSSINLLDR